VELGFAEEGTLSQRPYIYVYTSPSSTLSLAMEVENPMAALHTHTHTHTLSLSLSLSLSLTLMFHHPAERFSDVRAAKIRYSFNLRFDGGFCHLMIIR
jgi:hypothetical protein